jgi:hypothetical protein
VAAPSAREGFTVVDSPGHSVDNRHASHTSIPSLAGSAFSQLQFTLPGCNLMGACGILTGPIVFKRSPPKHLAKIQIIGQRSRGSQPEAGVTVLASGCFLSLGDKDRSPDCVRSRLPNVPTIFIVAVSTGGAHGRLAGHRGER